MGKSIKSSSIIHICLLLSVLSISHPARADLWTDHGQKSLEDGFDFTGLAIVGGGVVATLLVQQEDERIRADWGENKKLSRDQTKAGDFIGTGIPGIAIALTQLLLDTENGWAHSEALLGSFVTTSILKYSNNRPRPNGLNRHSMPSGHTSTSFTSATSLGMAYGWAVMIPGLAIASYVAMTRVSDDAHWASDTVAGATVGVFWGRATSFHHSGGGLSQLQPLWVPSQQLVGFNWEHRF